MTTARGQSSIVEEVKRRSGWAVFMGVLTAALGIVLIVFPFATASATTVFLGGVLTLVGVIELVLALYSQTPGTFLLRILLAVLYGFAGIMILAHPFAGTEGLTLFVGAMLIVRGILALIAAIRLRPLDGWGWFVVDSIANLAAGGFIVAKWPSSTSWAVGTLIGIAVLVTGISRTVFAVRLRRGASDLGRVAQGVA